MNRSDFREKNLRRWESTLRQIFPVAIPESCSWTEIPDIVSVLNKIGSTDNLSHAFMPDYGGVSFLGAEESWEDACIDLRSENSKYRLRPEILTFESFDGDYEWAYFRIDADHLAPTGVYTEEELAGKARRLGRPVIREALTELSPRHYEPVDIWERGYFGLDEHGEEMPLPENAARVNRYFHGAFVVFAEASPYNSVPSTYDARHTKMTSEEFRKYIAGAVEALRAQQEEQEHSGTPFADR